MLRPLLVRCTAPSLNHQQRAEARTRCAGVASGLIAAYLEAHVGKHLAAEGNKIKRKIDFEGAKKDVAEAAPHLSKTTQDLLTLAGAATNEIMVNLNALVAQVFCEPSLPQNLETYTELLAHFFAGGLRYARYTYDKNLSRRDHTATALGFGFAMAGFIPFVGQFAGLAAMVSDASLKHFWKPKDATGFIEHLANAFLANVSAGLVDKNPAVAAAFRTHFTDAFNSSRSLRIERPKVGMLRRSLGWPKPI